MQDSFSDWLLKNQFALNTIRGHVRNVAHWSRFLKDQNIEDLKAIRIGHILNFLDSISPNKKGIERHFFKKCCTHSIHRFLEFIEEKHGIRVKSKEPCIHEAIILQFKSWLKDKRHLSKATQKLRSQYLSCFLKLLEDNKLDLPSLTHKTVEELYLAYVEKKSTALRRSMQATLRSFFSFCHSNGQIKQDLGVAIPTLRTYRLANVPHGIPNNDALQLIAYTSQNSASGLRDRAVLQILYSYGVRGGQVRTLRLEDIHWEQGFIRFAAFKQGKETIQPLTKEVGEFLLSYLLNARPKVVFPEVFMKVRAPYRPLCRNAISQIVRNSFLRAGLKAPSMGGHVFRHNFASRMLAEGNSLKTIADMLGHRHQETTFQYTKIDFLALNRVSMDWPEVTS